MSWRGAGRQEAFDDEEREALALRAAQVPGWRGRGAVVHDDALFEEVFDEHATACGGGVQPAEVAHAVLAWREDVLQIPSQKLLSAERAGAAHAGAAVGVGEAHRLVGFVGDIPDIGHAALPLAMTQRTLFGTLAQRLDRVESEGDAADDEL